MNFIESVIRTTLNRYYQHYGNNKPKTSKTRNNTNTKKNEQIYIDIPYFNKATERLGKQLIKITSTVRPQLHIQPIQKPPPSVSTFFLVKDKLLIHLQSNVVYKIPCLNCSASYIGKTLRQVQRCTQEHGKSPIFDTKSTSIPPLSTNVQHILERPKRATKPIERYGMKSDLHDNKQQPPPTIHKSKTNQSALTKHMHEQHHQIDWNNIKILDRDTNAYRLLIRESLAIKQYRPSLNRTVNSAPLIIFPEGILTKKPTIKLKHKNQNSDNLKPPRRELGDK